MRKPLRLRPDLDALRRHAFYLTCLSGSTSDKDSRFLEAFYINKSTATSQAGYNNLPGAPGYTRKYWAMKRCGTLA